MKDAARPSDADGRACDRFQKLTPVALKFSPVFFQFLAISADFASFVAKLLPVAGNFVTRRVCADPRATLVLPHDSPGGLLGDPFDRFEFLVDPLSIHSFAALPTSAATNYRRRRG